MTKDIQAALLRACARFINKRLDPLENRISAFVEKADRLSCAFDFESEGGKKNLQRIAAEARSAIDLKQLQGPAGKDAEPINLKDVVDELLASDEINSLIELRVKEEIAKIPTPKDGKDGRDGKDGEKGDRGESGLRGEKGEKGDIGKAGEVGLRGERGEKGDDGKPGVAGQRGEKGDDGKPGVGLAGAMIDREGSLTVTTSAGEAIKLGPVVGRNGKDGADFSEVEFSYDGERGLAIRGKGGEIVKRLPIPIDRGYWKSGTNYERGDIVTEGGTAFIALTDTSTKPGPENKDWRIFARKGRDGKDGRNGIDKTASVALNA